MKTKIVKHLFDQQGNEEVIAERLMITAQRLIVLISQRDPRSLGSALSLFVQPRLQMRSNGRSRSFGGWSLSNRPLPRGGLPPRALYWQLPAGAPGFMEYCQLPSTLFSQLITKSWSLRLSNAVPGRRSLCFQSFSAWAWLTPPLQELARLGQPVEEKLEKWADRLC